MKRLLLMRHAKSSWADASLADFDRPLNERGLKAAPLVGRFMRRRRLRPDLILVGHNPGLEGLLELLTGESRRVPTAALARVALDVEKWGKVREGAGRVELFVRPKELAEE